MSARAQDSFDIEGYIRKLTYSDEVDEFARTLVAGNLRRLYVVLTTPKCSVRGCQNPALNPKPTLGLYASRTLTRLSGECEKHQHVCGLTGFDPMKGDRCPECEAQRVSRESQ